MGKASFATPQEATTLTGMLPGGVTPFGLPPGLPIWVDPGVLERDWVVFGGGTLATTGSFASNVARGFSGSGAIDVAAGTTLTVGGSAAFTSLTASNTGTLVLAGDGRDRHDQGRNAADSLPAHATAPHSTRDMPHDLVAVTAVSRTLC